MITGTGRDTVVPLTTRWDAIGTTVEILSARLGRTDHDKVVALARPEIAAMDEAISRFRSDSELNRLNLGRWNLVTPRFLQAVQTAVRVARLTDGLVVPTLGRRLIELGYDVDISVVRVRGGWMTAAQEPTPATPTDWRDIEVDAYRSWVRVPIDLQLDFGATGKALLADRIARRVETELLDTTGSSVLINLGGDCAVATRLPSGHPDLWRWGISIDDADRPDPVVAADRPADLWLARGGLATSSTRVRRWTRRGAEVHHIIDPRTLQPAADDWRCVTVVGPSCVDANAASTAAVVLGPHAPAWLADRRVKARLVGRDHEISCTPRWPAARAVQEVA